MNITLPAPSFVRLPSACSALLSHRASVLLVVVGLAATAFADSAATQPGLSSPPDVSSPRAALLTVYTAIRAGDIQTVKSCLIFDNAGDADVFENSIAQVCAPLRLMHAMEARFGDAGRKPFDPSVEKAIDDAVAKVKRAEIVTTGDKAVVAEKKAAVNPDAETELSGLTLRQSNGQWKVLASTFPDTEAGSGDMAPTQMALLRSLRNAQVSACEATIARLVKGEFQSADEAYAAYQTLLQPTARAAAKSSPPATAPSSTTR